MSDTAFNIWGVVTGALGTLSIIPILWALAFSQMPTVKLRALDALLAETDEHYRSSVEEGLISQEQFRLLMWGTRRRIERVRMRVDPTRTWSEEYANWKSGLSKDISVLCQELNTIRAHIARSSSEERVKLEVSGNATNPTLSRRCQEPVPATNTFDVDEDCVATTADLSLFETVDTLVSAGEHSGPSGSPSSGRIVPAMPPFGTPHPYPSATLHYYQTLGRRHLVSFVKRPTHRASPKRECRMSRRELLSRFGTDLLCEGMPHPSGHGGGTAGKASHCTRTRFKKLARPLRPSGGNVTGAQGILNRRIPHVPPQSSHIATLEGQYGYDGDDENDPET
ncbi:hypothetical protein C8Q79DRAFT_1119797 [Trametes meyenii]|nr:hypothetical protein C8Q79DRAFT_1119797 [Trametes meyenii]